MRQSDSPLGPSRSCPTSPLTSLPVLDQLWSSAGPGSTQPVSPAEKLHRVKEGRTLWALISSMDGPEEDEGVWSQKKGKPWGSQLTSCQIIPFTSSISLLLQDMLWLTQLVIFCLVFPLSSSYFLFGYCVLFWLTLAAKFLRQRS